MIVFFFVRIFAAAAAAIKFLCDHWYWNCWRNFWFQRVFVVWNQMAAVAACRRLGILGTNSGIGLTGFGGAFGNRALKFSPSIYNSSSMHFSQFVKSNGQRLFLVDTLALVIHIFLLYFVF
jgi:hypothetical protein